MAPRLIALDWGTSSLRAYLLGGGGAVLEARSAPLGIMRVPGGDFAAALEQVAGDWRRGWPGLRAIASGMVGSAQGWVEAPYLDCPAGADDLAGALVATPGDGPLLVPGLILRGGAPDVMRGEETQVAGALALRPELAARSRFVLPGTHSKWAEVRDGRVRSFRTFLTGELFAALRDHSILGRPARAAGPPGCGGAGPPEDGEPAEAFARGVAAARDGGAGVAPLLFSVRALVLAGRLRAAESLDYLSGLLIGDEVRCALDGDAAVVLVGEAALCRRYAAALGLFGAGVAATIEDAAAAGLWRIAERAGLTGAAAARG